MIAVTPLPAQRELDAHGLVRSARIDLCNAFIRLQLVSAPKTQPRINASKASNLGHEAVVILLLAAQVWPARWRHPKHVVVFLRNQQKKSACGVRSEKLIPKQG